METDEMKLADMEKAASATDYRFKFQKEWAMDPPPFILRKLPDDVIINIHRTKLNHLAKVSEMVSQINKIEAAVLNEISQMMKM